VGKTEEDVRCPECGAEDLERLTASGFAPLMRSLTPNQERRMNDKRGTDRGGAKQRFKQQREAEKRRASGKGAKGTDG
jgi:hypothetical protein